MAHSDRVTNALWMLEALTAAPDHRLSAAETRRALACTDEELNGYLDLLSTLADRQGWSPRDRLPTRRFDRP